MKLCRQFLCVIHPMFWATPHTLTPVHCHKPNLILIEPLITIGLKSNKMMLFLKPLNLKAIKGLG